MYRVAVALFANILLYMEEADLGAKVIENIEQIWDQVIKSDDQETIAYAALAIGKAHLAIGLDMDDDDTLRLAEDELGTCIGAAKKIGYQAPFKQASHLLEMLARFRGDDQVERSVMEDWPGEERLEEIRGILRMVSVRIAENWA